MQLDNFSFDDKTKTSIKKWLDGPYDDQTKKTILDLLKTNPEEINSAFSASLSFGTGGIRGIMGVGPNRMNIYTIRFATQGLCNYLKKEFPKEDLSVIVGYDNRNNSLLFAQESAKVLAGNGIKTYLFDSLCPTPIVSYGCRLKKCHAAIMITASHNPPSYNGYKVYSQDGSQISFPQDENIIKEVHALHDLNEIKLVAMPHPKIITVGEEIKKQYLEELKTLQFMDEQNKSFGSILSIVYSNLHGTGITILPDALKLLGFSSLSYVESQKPIDGNFSHAPLPNPEEKSALEPGIEQLIKKQADILLVTDPDADRIGVVVRHKNQAITLTGNQLAAILLFHILENKNKSIKNGAVIKSLVTTELFDEIAFCSNVSAFSVLTGFKNIAKLMATWEKTKEYTYLFGAEESYGYLPETFVRDKDAISTSCLIAEMALHYKLKNQTLIDVLHYLYAKFGVFLEQTFSITLKEGIEEANKLMNALRKNPVQKLGDLPIVKTEDFLQSDTHKSNMLTLFLHNRAKVVLRPSGTEPKMKIYLFAHEKHFTSTDEGLRKCTKTLSLIHEETKKFLNSFLS